METVRQNIKTIIKHNINNWDGLLTESDFNDDKLNNFLVEIATLFIKYGVKITTNNNKYICGITINNKYICSDILYDLLDLPVFNFKKGLIKLEEPNDLEKRIKKLEERLDNLAVEGFNSGGPVICKPIKE